MVGCHALTAEGLGLIPGWGTRIPQDMSPKKKRQGKSVDQKRYPSGICEQTLRWAPPGWPACPNLRISVLIRREEHRGDSQVKTEAGITAVCLQAKGGQQPPKAKRKAWDRFSLRAAEGTYPGDTMVSDIWPPELWRNRFKPPGWRSLAMADPGN